MFAAEKHQFTVGTSPNICIVGAGFAGLTAGIKIKTELGIQTFQIFEEHSEVGGTWLVNRYPGVASDTQSHFYSWSFELNSTWSQNYAPGCEIWEYISGVARKYDLYSQIQLNTKVMRMEWIETTNKWKVTSLNKSTNQESENFFDLIINATGTLRTPNYPPEFNNFTGPKIHSAKWDDSIDLKGKIVGVVGSGASAVQVINEIGPKAKELFCYQRQPAWVIPRSQYDFWSVMKWLFAKFPILMWIFRWYIYITSDFRILVFSFESFYNKIYTMGIKQWMANQISRQDPKFSQLTPSFPIGCKRIIFSSEYFGVLALPHVKIIRENIAKCNGNEVITVAGKKTKLDAIILATGFAKQEYFSPMTVIGLNGVDINQKWLTDGPSAYYGICCSVAPNCFLLVGPNTFIGHSSVLFMIECQVQFILNMIKEMKTQNAKRVVVKLKAQCEYMKSLEDKMKDTVWFRGNCDSWYQNAQGIVTSIWPWSCTTYWFKTRSIDNTQFIYS